MYVGKDILVNVSKKWRIGHLNLFVIHQSIHSHSQTLRHMANARKKPSFLKSDMFPLTPAQQSTLPETVFGGDNKSLLKGFLCSDVRVSVS